MGCDDRMAMKFILFLVDVEPFENILFEWGTLCPLACRGWWIAENGCDLIIQ